ncbi:MAG: DUF2784 family protein [Acidithiobacillus sp.]|uniref:DUF2784 family protein n=1 Tax=Acidithiobacillus ferriphilus TaxID=1689834 RepID=UPI00231F10BA|nr:DUF2784 family protein [Acidithiobacillus ferriphilus]MDA8151205.1 DUF2784 family protein [Acidithiobacillus sp.]
MRKWHLSIAVAIQAVLSRACFLTIWPSQLQQAAGRQSYRQPFTQTWVNHLPFWNLPIIFSALFMFWHGVTCLFFDGAYHRSGPDC